MRRIEFAMVALLGGLLMGAPQEAAAQSDSGWWDWALVEEVQRAADPDERKTLSDILREQIEEARRGVGQRPADPRDRTDDRDRDRDGDWERDRRADRRGADARGNAGPPFCRNGQGHPVHGRQWCRDKGFGQSGQGPILWEDRGWEDIILGSPRGDDRRRGTLDEGGLIDVLGDVILGRVEGERQRLGTRGPLEGRWLRLRDGGRVLQIRAGDTPLAELTDLDGDGRVDVSLVRGR